MVEDSSDLEVAERLKEISQRDLQGRDQPLQRSEADVSFAALDAAHVVAMKRGPCGELFLRDASRLAQVANPLADELLKRASHCAILASCTLSCYTL